MRVLVLAGTGSFATRVSQKALERGHDARVDTRGRRPLLDGLAPCRPRAERTGLRTQAGSRAAR
jgi:uncharacterized protein YbjT (DUF2867 family)